MPVGTISQSDIAPMTFDSGNMDDDFYRGNDGSLQHSYNFTSYDNQGGVVIGTPAAVTGPVNGVSSAINVFARGTKNDIFWKYYATGWSGWADLGAGIASAS
jgi:hypothetical protein